MSNKIRCFVAIEIPENVKQEIDAYVLNLKKLTPDIKWIKAKNMHITLKFLGEISPELVANVKNNLKNISDISKSFNLGISNFTNRIFSITFRHVIQ